MTPIHAVIKGSDRCDAESYTVRANAPVLALCRTLLAAGYDPAMRLHAYRGDVLALKARSIGEGAKLTVKDTRFGTPVFRPWQNVAAGVVSATPAQPERLAA
jgi:hypothetical protein